MASFIAAGFSSSRTSVLLSTKSTVSRALPAPEMQQMGRSVGYDCLLSRISSGICDNASKRHRLDLERLSRRADTESRFRGMLGHLKHQVAGKAAVRERFTCADTVVELAAMAS